MHCRQVEDTKKESRLLCWVAVLLVAKHLFALLSLCWIHFTPLRIVGFIQFRVLLKIKFIRDELFQELTLLSRRDLMNSAKRLMRNSLVSITSRLKVVYFSPNETSHYLDLRNGRSLHEGFNNAFHSTW